MNERSPHTSPSEAITIRVVDTDDTDALERHIAFERAHGTPRHDVDELRAWLGMVDAALLLQAQERDGQLVGCATASLIPTFGDRSVHVNAFALTGGDAVLRALAGEIERWDAAARAEVLLAHVSAPSQEHERDWLAAGFECAGVRAAIERVVTPDDVAIDSPLPSDVEIVPLATRTDLAPEALRVWNECHADVPSPLPIRPTDRLAWLAEFGIADGDPYPASLLIAVTPTGEVCGVAYVHVKDRATGVGDNRFTGVTRAWRGHGLATALKVATIRWAARSGITLLRSSNDSANAAMRAVNQRLGYEERIRIVMFSRPVARKSADR